MARVVMSLAVAAAAAPVKVLPLGDSITFGCGDGCNGLGCGDQCAVSRPACQSGWRSGLWRLLSPNSTESLEWDFVGTQENGPEDTDRHHEGHPGFKVEDVLALSDQWLQTNPDVVLLHLGTNNLGKGFQSAETALSHMSEMLDTIFGAWPDVRLLLSTLIGSSSAYAGGKHAEYNEGLKKFAQELSSSGRQIELVDMATESGIGAMCDSENCCLGGIHPNSQGYELMAKVWYSHLTRQSLTLV